MQVEVSDNWIAVGSVIGAAVVAAITAFRQQYAKSREGERASAAASPAIAATAIGAAFVDRSTAQDVAVIREDVSALRKIAEDRQEHDDEDRVKRVAQEAARDEVRKRAAQRE